MNLSSVERGLSIVVICAASTWSHVALAQANGTAAAGAKQYRCPARVDREGYAIEDSDRAEGFPDVDQFEQFTLSLDRFPSLHDEIMHAEVFPFIHPYPANDEPSLLDQLAQSGKTVLV